MQDKDSEVLNYQRKRRKRITKIRYSIILIVAGWIVLSMILVVVLFVKMTSLEHKLDQLVTSSSEQNTDQINAGAAADPEYPAGPALRDRDAHSVPRRRSRLPYRSSPVPICWRFRRFWYIWFQTCKGFCKRARP